MPEPDRVTADAQGRTIAVLFRPLQMVSLGFTFLVFSLPIYSKELGADALTIGGLYTIFMLTTLVMRPVVGWGLDRYGRKRFLLAALLTYALTMAVFAISNSLQLLYLGRFFQGLASALLWISVNTIVTDLASSAERGQALGQVQENMTRGELVGALAGFAVFSALGAEQGWTLLFLGYAAMALVAAAMVWRRVPETQSRTVDHPSVAAQQAGQPIISVWLLRLMVIVFTTGASAAMIAPIYLIFLQDRFTTDIGLLAWAFFPGGVVYSLLPSRFGRLSDRFGRAPLMAAGLVLVGLFSFALPHLPNLTSLAILYALTAAGWAMADPAEAAMVADLTGGAQRGRVYGLYDFAGRLGASIGPLLGGWLYDQIGQTVPFYANGALMLLSALWVMVLLRTAPRAISNPS